MIFNTWFEYFQNKTGMKITKLTLPHIPAMCGHFVQLQQWWYVGDMPDSVQGWNSDQFWYALWTLHIQLGSTTGYLLDLCANKMKDRIYGALTSNKERIVFCNSEMLRLSHNICYILCMKYECKHNYILGQRKKYFYYWSSVFFTLSKLDLPK